MYYNPKWQGIYSLENFAAWLKQQPKRETYDFCQAWDCVAARYLRAHNVKNYSLSCDQLRQYGWFRISIERPWTMRAAYRRARRLIITQRILSFFGYRNV